jgi:uncharacterized membrane protein
MRYRLRTLLIVLAVGPVMLWAIWLDWAAVAMNAVVLLCLAWLFRFNPLHRSP